MESGKILDFSIIASSILSSSYLPYYGRLRREIGRCSWCPENSQDPGKSWLQVDFGAKTNVTGVATQGSCNELQWVKSYVILYSDDALNWRWYSEDGARKVSATL